MVNGLERLLYGSLPSSLARSLTVGMRLGNNFLGSVSGPPALCFLCSLPTTLVNVT